MKTIYEQIITGNYDSDFAKSILDHVESTMKSDDVLAKCATLKTLASLEKNYITTLKSSNKMSERSIRQTELLQDVYSQIILNNNTYNKKLIEMEK
ncbi:MAG: hypothetical protein ACRCX2_01135 [Paraclostridium sp.]